MIFAKNDQHGAAVLDDEAVLLNSESGRFFRLEDVALSIWNGVDGDLSVDELSHEIASEYDVDRDTCRGDTLAFCEELEKLGFLIRV